MLLMIHRAQKPRERKMPSIFEPFPARYGASGHVENDQLDPRFKSLCDQVVNHARRIAELEAALKPFADAVYRDNGDVTIVHVDAGHYLRAKRLLQG